MPTAARPTVGPLRGVRDVPTWKMTAVELARVFAHHHGYTTTVADAGWIRRPDGRPVVQGWAGFAEMLVRRGWVVPGRGVNWCKAGERPVLPRFTRPAR